MAILLYNLALRCYYFFLRASAPFHPKAAKWIDGRRHWSIRLAKATEHNNSPTIWMHCASLGEFEQGRPLLEKLRTTHPDHFLLLTFFSPSGYDIRKNYEGADHVAYLPLDTAANARMFLNIVEPHLAIFIKYDFWYHFLTTLHHNSIPTILVSALFRPGQIFFRPWGGLFRQMLNYFTQIFVQDDNSQKLIQQYAPKVRTTIVGDTRIDRVQHIAQQAKRFPEIEQWIGPRRILLCGSTWSADEKYIAHWYNNLPNQQKDEAKTWRLLIAPHDIAPHRLQQIQQRFPGQTILHSQLSATPSQTKKNILLIDNIGMLSSLYRYALIAYIGGGFGTGIHNILEPAAFGLPICFGPRYQKFAEATTLVDENGAFVIRKNEDLRQIINQLEDKAEYKRATQVVQNFINTHQGATSKIMSYIQQLI